jgi:hypothetical protein
MTGGIFLLVLVLGTVLTEESLAKGYRTMSYFLKSAIGSCERQIRGQEVFIEV